MGMCASCGPADIWRKNPDVQCVQNSVTFRRKACDPETLTDIRRAGAQILTHRAAETTQKLRQI